MKRWRNKLDFWTFLGLIVLMSGCATVPGDKTPMIVNTIKTGFETAVSETLILVNHYQPNLIAPIEANLEYTSSELNVFIASGKIDVPTVVKLITDTFSNINKQASILPPDISLVIVATLNVGANMAGMYLQSETVPANVLAYVGAVKVGIDAGIADFQANPMLHGRT